MIIKIAREVKASGAESPRVSRAPRSSDINGNFSSRSICYEMIMRVPQKEVIGQRARSRRLKLRLKSKHSLRVEFIEHLNLMNLTRIGQAEINWRVRSPRLPTKGEWEKHFIDEGSITRVCHWSSSHSIDEFHLFATKGRACEKN